MSADLVRFVEARIAEDEAAARQVVAPMPISGLVTVHLSSSNAVVGLQIDPARVLRQCEAFRRIVARAQQMDMVESEWGVGILRALASAWSDHPDYRQEWAA